MQDDLLDHMTLTGGFAEIRSIAVDLAEEPLVRAPLSLCTPAGCNLLQCAQSERSQLAKLRAPKS